MISFNEMQTWILLKTKVLKNEPFLKSGYLRRKLFNKTYLNFTPRMNYEEE